MSTCDFILNQELLSEYFEYRNGELYWKKLLNHHNQVKINDIAGHIHYSPNKVSYKRVTFFKKRYFVHQLVFLFFNGYIPKQIDHIDGNGLNNKIENLREATSQQNSLNRGLRKDNKSGVKNIYWRNDSKKWRVTLNVDGVNKNFGSYYDLEFAKFVAQTMRYKYHKEFARHQ
jgi:hypothetical protein